MKKKKTMSHAQSIYMKYSSFYDFLFGRIFQPGRILCTTLINQSAAKEANILEIGLNGGFILPLYRPDLSLTGIDISHQRINEVATLSRQQTFISKKFDIEKLAYQDNTFDYVVAFYIVSLVPDLNQFLSELCRVCKKNGHVIIVNHFSSANKSIHSLENKLPQTHNIANFNPDVSVDAIITHENLQLMHQHNTNLFGYWKLLYFKNMQD